jgi:hypothetical protein
MTLIFLVLTLAIAVTFGVGVFFHFHQRDADVYFILAAIFTVVWVNLAIGAATHS